MQCIYALHPAEHLLGQGDLNAHIIEDAKRIVKPFDPRHLIGKQRRRQIKLPLRVALQALLAQEADHAGFQL